MANIIACPHCDESIEVTNDVCDYDWNSGCSFNGLAEIACPYCHKPIQVEAHASIDYVEVADGV